MTVQNHPPQPLLPSVRALKSRGLTSAERRNYIFLRKAARQIQCGCLMSRLRTTANCMLIASKVWLFSEPIFVWSISLGTVVILSVITQLVLVRLLSGLGCWSQACQSRQPRDLFLGFKHRIDANQVIPFFNPHLIRARVAVRNMHSKLLSSSKMITATTLGFLFTLFFCTDCSSYREAQVSGRTCITRRNNMVGA